MNEFIGLPIQKTQRMSIYQMVHMSAAHNLVGRGSRRALTASAIHPLILKKRLTTLQQICQIFP